MIKYAMIVFCLLYGNNIIAADAANLINGEFNATEKSERAEMAVEISSMIEAFSAYLPSLKPDEIIWINKEQLEIEKLRGTGAWNARIIQLHRSREFQLQKLKTMTENIQQALNCAKNPIVKIKSEMACWALVAHNLSDDSSWDDAIAILRSTDVFPKEMPEDTKIIEMGGHVMNLNWYARGINEYLVIPFLAGNING